MSTDFTTLLLVEILGKIFAYLPKKARIGRQQGFDIAPIDTVAVVCKRWHEICQSLAETAPYVQLFRREFSLTAPILFKHQKSARKWYLDVVDQVLTIDRNRQIIHAAKEGYEQVFAQMLKRPLDSGKECHHELHWVDDVPEKISLTNLGLALYGCFPGIVEEILAHPATDPQLPVARFYGKEISAMEFLLAHSHAHSRKARLYETMAVLLCHVEIKIEDNVGSKIKSELAKRFAEKFGAKQPDLLKSLLLGAVDQGDREAVAAILSTVKLNFQQLGNLYGHLICLGGDQDFVQLLPHIPDPNWKDLQGDTLISMAFKSGNPEMVSALTKDERIALWQLWETSDRVLRNVLALKYPKRDRSQEQMFFLIFQAAFNRSSTDVRKKKLRELIEVLRSHNPLLAQELNEKIQTFLEKL